MVGILDAANCLSKLSGPKRLATDFGRKQFLSSVSHDGPDG